MLIQFSVILAFSTLFIASIFDVKSQKGDVPASVLFLGILGGLTLHALQSLNTGSIEPLYISIMGGLGFTAYGFISYVLDMWGGADMLGISVLGFSTSYFLIESSGVIGLLDLFINMMAVAFIYALIFGGVKGLNSRDTRKSFIKDLKQKKSKVMLLATPGLIFPALMNFNTGLTMFVLYEFMVLVYFFFQSVESEVMSKEIDVEELEVGDVVSFEGIEMHDWKVKNLIGISIEKAKSKIPEGRINDSLAMIQNRYGYSEIVGLTEEGLEEIRDSDTEKVEIKEGIRFMPVFPLALAITVYGISVMMFLIYSL
ncbi:hypothetical protein HRED_00391 [Candidatus Haloredivivus sp. G17]|nr:hypothetical protein HRED_00391 [Candidatus Haloredivivus sp. G17]